MVLVIRRFVASLYTIFLSDQIQLENYVFLKLVQCGL